ncbi:hypothetical protein Ddc_14987 [Ditylenchus destructor]|nr:hypothetical protein Ddc_14987 [Ditylenchus destructor]
MSIRIDNDETIPVYESPTREKEDDELVLTGASGTGKWRLREMVPSGGIPTACGLRTSALEQLQPPDVGLLHSNTLTLALVNNSPRPIVEISYCRNFSSGSVCSRRESPRLNTRLLALCYF